MTREWAKEISPIIAAYGEGKEIQRRLCAADDWRPFDDAHFLMDVEYRIKPEPKKRLMTREEMLGFLANTPGVVVRCDDSQWSLPADWMFDYKKTVYEWATIDKQGNIGEPHAFETEE